MRFWYATLAGLALAAILHVSFPNKANAQQTTTIYDSRGRPVEQAYTIGNNTFITNGWGTPMGSVVTSGTPSPTQPIIPLPELALPPLR